MTEMLTAALVVDDDPQIRRFLRTSLGAHGFRVVEAGTGRSALTLFGIEKPEILLIDLGLPDMDGFEIIRRIRAVSKVPIVVLSVRNDEKAKVEALELGADDYLEKPFGMGELVARPKTALRHRLQEQGAEPVFRCGGLTVDLVRRHVTLDGAEIGLSPIEFKLLRLLVIHAGRVITHQQLLREAWGEGENVQYLRVFIRQLRQKLEPDPQRPRHILTEPGVGYRLVEGEAMPASEA